MIIIRCDRCGADADLHARHLEVEMANTDLCTYSTADRTFHLCGYCWSRVLQLINTPDMVCEKAPL